jgi:hypothetical protein
LPRKSALTVRQAPIVIGVPEVERLTALQRNDAGRFPPTGDSIDEARLLASRTLAAAEGNGVHEAGRVVEPLIEARRSFVCIRVVEVLRVG